MPHRSVAPKNRAAGPSADSMLQLVGLFFGRLLGGIFPGNAYDPSGLRIHEHFGNVPRAGFGNVEGPDEVTLLILNFGAFDRASWHLLERDFFCFIFLNLGLSGELRLGWRGLNHRKCAYAKHQA